MPRKPVDVSQYDRERNGQPEHVRDYTRIQDVAADPAPSMLPLKRRSRAQEARLRWGPTFTWTSPWDIRYDITAKIVDEHVPFPNDPDSRTYHNHFRVTVRDSEGGRTSFDFYGSQADADAGKVTMDEDDLMEAFKSFLDDSLAGLMSFDDFASEFGYDQDSRTAERIWKATQRSTEKARRLGFDTEDRLVDSVNALNEEEERRYAERRGA